MSAFYLGLSAGVAVTLLGLQIGGAIDRRQWLAAWLGLAAVVLNGLVVLLIGIPAVVPS